MSASKKEMRQKVALVTGASSGIGLAVSKELAKKGYKVYAAARRFELLEPLKSHGIIPVKLDVTDPEAIQKFKKVLSEELEDLKLDILFNNAGQSCTMPAIDVTDSQVEQAFNVNVFAPISLTRELAQYIINAKGTILFTGSLAGVVPFPFSSVYCATKAAIHSYAKVLHLEMKGFGVRVINVMTGGVRTNIGDKRPLPKGSVFDFPEGREALTKRQSMSQDYSPMEPEIYAQKVVNDILSPRDPIVLYRGTFATILSFFSAIVPDCLAEYLLSYRFGIFKVFKAWEANKKGEGETADLHLE